MTLQTELLMKGSPAIGKRLLPGAPATDERGLPSIVNGTINVGATSCASPNGHAPSADPGPGILSGKSGRDSTGFGKSHGSK
jgi:hypothetical protein